jgi:AcrR family transcriptional regulator
MARRSDHTREELKELALSSAELLLNEKPASALSTRQIATRMGYTVGTLYQIFHNLPDLLLHVNARSLKRLYQQCRKVHDPEQSAEQNILAFAEAYIHFAKMHSGRWELMFNSDILNDKSIPDKELPDWYLNQVNGLFSLIETELRRIRPDYNDARIIQASRVLWSSVHGICVLAINDKLFTGGDASASELIQSLILNFLSGWRRQDKNL